MSTQAPQDQYVRVGSINTRLWTVGKEGSTVVLLHGLGGFIETWIQNVHALAERHRAYVLDLVGFGRADKPAAPYSFPYFAQFVLDLMDTQNVERATLCGNSLSGGIALQFALQFPDAVEKLVRIPNAQLHILDACGHVPQIECPKEVNALVLDFLAS